MMNNYVILFTSKMSTLQTLKGCNYMGIHKSIQFEIHHQTSIKSFFSPLQKDSDSESLGYSAASMAALEDSAAAFGDSAAALEDLRTMGDSGVF